MSLEFIQANWPYLVLFLIGLILLWKFRKDIIPKGGFKIGGGKVSSKQVLSLYTTDMTAKARDGGVDEPRVPLAELFVVEAEAGHDAGAEVLEHDVGLLGEAEEEVE